MKALIIIHIAIAMSVISCSQKKAANYQGNPDNGSSGNNDISYDKDYDRSPDDEGKALAILKKNCESCHNQTNAQGGFSGVTNVDYMLASKRYIIPGSPEQSLIYKRISATGTDFMPPSGRLSPEDIETVKEWIAEFKKTDGSTSGQAFSDEQVFDLVAQDFEKNVDDRDEQNIRYFTFHNLERAGTPAGELKLATQSLSKVMNSISRSVNVVKPEPIAGSRDLIYRVNLDDFGMDTTIFKNIMQNVYVYSADFDNITSFQAIKDRIGDRNFLIRGDWFAATALMPNVYAGFMNLGNELQLQQDEQINLNLNVRNLDVIRSGFKKSGVSNFNRVIERQETNDKRAFWQSYDFNNNDQNASNIFQDPFGPANVINGTNREFQQAGGEMIYQLRNGFLAFFLVNNLGDRLDKGPVTIVQNTNGPQNFINAVVNGASCLDCHRKGFLYKKDEINDFVKTEDIFGRDEIDIADDIYVNDTTFKKAIDSDSARFIQAMTDAGIDTNPPEEHVKAMILGFYQDMNFDKVQAELGTTKEELTRILGRNPFDKDWGPLRQGGIISRDDFNALYGRAIEELDSDIRYRPPGIGDFIVTPECMAKDLTSMVDCFEERN